MISRVMFDSCVQALRTAIKNAKLAVLTGHNSKTGGIWALDALRDASLELRAAEKRRKLTDAKKELVDRLDRCFVRTEPLGRDRFRNRYWHLSNDYMGRIWAEKASKDYLKDGPWLKPFDEEDDLLPLSLKDQQSEAAAFLSFSRMEYHIYQDETLAFHTRWGGHCTDKSLRSLIKCLDERGIRESTLKASLKEAIESRVSATDRMEGQAEQLNGISSSLIVNSNLKVDGAQQVGDEEAFHSAKLLFMRDSEMPEQDLLGDITSAIGRRIRLRFEEKCNTNGGASESPARYEMGTVTSWGKTSVENNGAIDAHWVLSLDKGGELTLAGCDVIAGMVRAMRWTSQDCSYAEDDHAHILYRNKLGKFCGKASEAAGSATAQAFSRFMVKREGELYIPLKNRSLENNWGGKSGARNLWLQSLRDNSHNFEALRNALIMLESAFYELITGESAPFISDESSSEARQTVFTPEARFNVELESIGNDVTGLWNSPETRSIFLEVTKSTTSIGVLALALDLLCRNCKVYLDKVSVSSRWSSNVSIQETARVNSNGWGVTSTRRAASQVSYEHFFN